MTESLIHALVEMEEQEALQKMTAMIESSLEYRVYNYKEDQVGCAQKRLIDPAGARRLFCRTIDICSQVE